MSINTDDRFFACLAETATNFPEPEDLFSGQRLNGDSGLPDNLLVFYHDFASMLPNVHGRHTLVLPLDRMTYIVENRRITLERGNALLIPPFATRFLQPDSKGYRRIFITFELASGGTLATGTMLYRLNEAAGAELVRFMEQYQKCNTLQAALRLRLFIAEATPVANEISEKAVNNHIVQAVKYVEKNLSKGCSVKEIAEHLGLSSSYLRMRFRRDFGISLGQYVAEQRLNVAKYLLRHTTGSISQVASQCGFANVFVFSAFFRKKTGVPPTAYRTGYRH